MAYQGSNPIILYRRFRKEISKLPSEYNYMKYKIYVLRPDINEFLLNYDYDHGYVEDKQLKELVFPISFYLKNTNLHINLLITNMEYYPFQPPQILFKNRDLLSYYRSNLFIKYKKYLIKRKCCLVCSSLLSKSNWSCVTHLNDVFYEMIRNFVYIKRSIEMFHMEKILLKYVGDKYLIDYILNFL